MFVLYQGCNLTENTKDCVRSRNYFSFDGIAETELEEESAIFSTNEKYKIGNTNSERPKCSNCNKFGHAASRCYLKDKKYTKFNQVSIRNEKRKKKGDITCYNCQGKRHMAKHCRKPKKRLERQGLINPYPANVEKMVSS
jgi:hypothetical protein